MRVIVVGAGIGGLSAAFDLARAGVDVTVLEADERLGGKIHTEPFAGLPALDCGADAFLARVPWAVQLCRDLGIADDLVSPAPLGAYIYTGGALRAIPKSNVLGVPLDLDELRASGIVSNNAVDLAARDLERTVDDAPDDDSLGSMVRRRLGDEVLEQLVDPLLGGIYAGHADTLSLTAGAPQIADAAGRDASLIRALRAQREAALAQNPGAPVFFAPPGGMAQLVVELERALSSRIVRNAPVRAVERDGDRWVVDGAVADAVIFATPAHVTASLLAESAPVTAGRLAAIDYAGVALVSLAFAPADIGVPLDASGFLVPKTEGLALTACSWSSSKWPHLGRGQFAIVRASVGHYGNEHALALDDKALVRTVLAELGPAMALRGEPVEIRVNRWPAAFPQYTPGHSTRIEELMVGLAVEAPGLRLAGAAYGGIGIPAVIRVSRQVAAELHRAG